MCSVPVICNPVGQRSHHFSSWHNQDQMHLMIKCLKQLSVHYLTNKLDTSPLNLSKGNTQKKIPMKPPECKKMGQFQTNDFILLTTKCFFSRGIRPCAYFLHVFHVAYKLTFGNWGTSALVEILPIYLPHLTEQTSGNELKEIRFISKDTSSITFLVSEQNPSAS